MRLELVFVLCFITYLEAATLVVPTEYATIQAAINSAQSNDIIQINSGTYNEKLVFGPSYNADGVTIVGASPSNTIVTNGALWSFSRQIKGLTFKNLQFVGPVTGQKWMFDFNATTFGVSGFVLDTCHIDGNSGSQLGLRFNNFNGNLTITNSDFTSVGWGIIETGTGSTYDSPGIFDHIWIENTVFHECYGALNLRGNANVSTNAIILKSNSWIHISNDYSDKPWPLKGFEAFHVKSVNLLNCNFNNISKGVVGHGGATKGMICEMWDVTSLVIANNNFTDCYQGIALRSGPTTLNNPTTYKCPSVRCNSNSFEDLNQYAVNVSCVTNGPIDLSYNYWGDNSGPSQDQITGPGSSVVSTFPWYVNGPGGAVAVDCTASCGHGSCDYITGACSCDEGYTGTSCETEEEPAKKKGFPTWAAVLIPLLIVLVVVAAIVAYVVVRRNRGEEHRSFFSKNYGTT